MKNNKRNDKRYENVDKIYRILKEFNDAVTIPDAKKAINIWRDVIKLDVFKFSENQVEKMFNRSVIYFLIKENEVVYVGETTSLMTRISQHYNEGKKDFDSFRFVLFEGTDTERKQKEREEILFHKPKYNYLHNTNFYLYEENK